MKILQIAHAICDISTVAFCAFIQSPYLSVCFLGRRTSIDVESTVYQQMEQSKNGGAFPFHILISCSAAPLASSCLNCMRSCTKQYNVYIIM